MIQEQTIKFNGRKANPDKILIGMVSDNISEAIKFILPVIDAGQSAFIGEKGDAGADRSGRPNGPGKPGGRA